MPQEFLTALDSLTSRPPGPGISLREVEGPRRIAPYSVAFEATVVDPRDPESTELASGRFIVLYDPHGQDAWAGRFRIVTLVSATTDPEIAADPLFATVAWSWLEDALAPTDAHAVGGTVTRVLSDAFGVIGRGAEEVAVEVRASWSPGTSDLSPHLLAWCEVLGSVAGTPPQPDGVTSLRPRHGTIGS